MVDLLDSRDTLKHQEEYTKHFYYDVDKLNLSERKEITKNQILGMIGELVEFQEAVKILPWKAGQESLDYNNIKEELIDVYHFFMNLCNLWGIRDEETLKKIYFQKNELNYKRGKVHEKPTTDFKVGEP
jgi:NTP pyrophosphatase (non-canonical NTP hydrolase)